MEDLIPPVAPAIVLSVLVGTFQTCLYIVIRGTIGKHLPLTLVAAIAGAFVGHLIGRLEGDPLQLGDFNVLWASVMAWVGIIVVAGIVAIRPVKRPDRSDDDASRGAPGTATGAGTEGTGDTTTVGPGGRP